MPFSPQINKHDSLEQKNKTKNKKSDKELQGKRYRGD